MSYLASTNSIFGARSSQARLPAPVQYCYMQTADILAGGGGNQNFLTNKASFTLESASTNVVDDLFTAETYATSNGVNVATIRIPITGIWSLSWTVRFQNTTTENGTWFRYRIPSSTITQLGIAGWDSSAQRLTTTTLL